MIPADPPLALNGGCANCGGPRKMPATKPLYLRHAVADPFCSAECARAWYGVPAPAAKPPAPRGYTSRLDGHR